MNLFPNLIPTLLSERENKSSQIIASSGYRQTLSAQSKADSSSQIAVKEILFQVSSSGKWLYLDENWEALSGFHARMCLGNLFLDYFDSSERNSLASLFQAIICGQRQSFQFLTQLLRKNNVPINATISACRLLNERRTTIGITGTIQIQDLENRTQQDLKQFIQSLPIAAGILEIRGNGLSYSFTNPATDKILKTYFNIHPKFPDGWPTSSSVLDYLYVLRQKCEYSQQANKSIQFEYKCFLESQTVWLLHTIAPLDPFQSTPQFSCVIEDVSGDREKLRQICESESRYRSVLEALTEYVHCCSPDYLFTFANKAYCRFRKKTADQLIGKSIFDDIPSVDQTEVKQHFDSLSRDNPIAVGENRTISPEGKVKWHQWIDCAIFDDAGKLIEVQSVGRDITQRKITEETLKVLNKELAERTQDLQQALRFEAILKRIIDKVRDSLDETHILDVVVRELGKALELEFCMTELVSDDDISSPLRYECSADSQFHWENLTIPNYSKIRTQVFDGDNVSFSWSERHYEKQATPGRYSAHICPIVDDSRVLGSLFVLKKAIYNFEQAEISLFEQIAIHCAIAIRQARLYQAAQAQVKELERLNLLKDDFLSTVSHELRTPITSMKMAIRMLRVSQSEEKRTQYLNALESQCQREASLVNDLLDLQRLQSGASPLRPSEIKLQAWIAYLTQSFTLRIHQRNQTLNVRIDPELTSLWTDEPSLHRILAELLNNACKYTPDGGTISLSVQSSSSPNELAFLVSNREAEIPAEEISRIFEKFYRIPSSDRWKQGGTGLGLALISQLVEHLGGTIQVISHYKQVTFTIQIPDLQTGVKSKG